MNSHYTDKVKINLPHIMERFALLKQSEYLKPPEYLLQVNAISIPNTAICRFADVTFS